jgi:hypothetical protein
MSGFKQEWVIVIAFFLSFFVVTFAEAKWLSRVTATALTRSFAIAFIPNVFTITVGFFFSAVVFGMIVMFVTNNTPNAGVGESTVRTGIGLALLAPLVILIFAKRVTLVIFRQELNLNPWLYAVAASVLFLVAVLLPTVAVSYLV